MSESFVRGYLTWDESAHPREPTGGSEGGQFAPAGGGSSLRGQALNVAEKGAVEGWSWSGRRSTAEASNHQLIRQFQAGGLTSDHKDYARISQMSADLNAALEKLPVHEGDKFRGMRGLTPKAAEAIAVLGNEITFDAVTSFSASKGVAEKFAKHRSFDISKEYVTFSLKGRAGADVSSFSKAKGESEIVIPKGTRTRIISVRRVKKYRSLGAKAGWVRGYSVKLEVVG